MWMVGDWGQASPWSRASGVSMTKGEDGVWVGELSLPKGTEFDIKILKSTVSTTSGGDNKWSATRYESVLNMSASYDFGEFTDNLIPNGDFEEGQVKWTPAECVRLNTSAVVSGKNILAVGGKFHASCASDVFVVPPNQTLRLTGYLHTWKDGPSGVVTMKVVTPQQQTLFELSNDGTYTQDWSQFSKTFKTADVPTECQIVLSGDVGDGDWTYAAFFDSLSLVSP